MSCVAEIIDIFASGEGRAGCRLDRYDIVVCFAAQLLAHERRDEAAEIGSAACATDDHVSLYIVHLERRLGLQTDDRLVQQNLVENAAQHIAVTFCSDSDFNRFGDRGAKTSVLSFRMIGQHLTADIGRI